MKKLILTAAIASVLSTSAFAATEGVAGGQVNFTGKVTNVSCDISVDGQGADTTVALSPVSVAEVKAAGNDVLLRQKSFTIDVSKCDPAAQSGKKLNVLWTSGNTVTGSTNGYLANINAGSNINLALSTGSDLIIPGLANQAKVAGAESAGVTRFTYNVGYISNDAENVTVGDVESYAIYQVTYE